MKKKNKGFTLIELLAVIVIIGLLMAIAIPSVTKYINQSKKKTLASTINNYIGSLVNDVNDSTYSFNGSNTIYAVPIKCIALEKGGTNPFGDRYPTTSEHWAHVLVQPNDESYTYGFTFKDSKGYGMEPVVQKQFDHSLIKTGLNLTKLSDNTTNSWDGFKENLTLKVLSAVTNGDNVSTCAVQSDVEVADSGLSEEQLVEKILKI